jgi:hypothetical protein
MERLKRRIVNESWRKREREGRIHVDGLEMLHDGDRHWKPDNEGPRHGEMLFLPMRWSLADVVIGSNDAPAFLLNAF